MSARKKATFTIFILSLIFSLAFATGVSAVGPTVKWVDQTGGSDTNDGNSETTAYATLQKALDESESGTDAARSFIYVKSGTYGETGLFSTAACQGYSYPTAILIKDLDYLTIQAAAGGNPVVKPATAVAADIVSVSIENSNHLVIDNLDSDQTIAQFDNWHVCNSDDLTVRNSTFQGGEDGIDFNNSFDTALIEKNAFIGIDTGDGDEVLDFTDGTYANVTIQDNLFENNYRHITVFPPSGSSATNFLIRRNIMNGTTSQEAVRLIGPNGVTLENNVIMNSAQQGLYIDSGSANINVWHNSFFNNGFEELRTKVNTVNIQIKNNIFSANGTYAAMAAPTSSLPGEDFNLVYNAGTSTESSSQPAVTSYGANTLSGQDPLFVSTTPGSEDLHLQSGSPAIEAGTGLGVIEDLEKGTRPNPAGTDPDLGAYEFGAVFVYTFDGFFAPIDMGFTNTAKAGQAIPVKWRLTDANGDPVDDPASFVKLYSYSVSCTDFAGTPLDALEEFASGSSGLQSLGDGYWQFNWKTPKSYANTCRLMYVEFADGQKSPEVQFQFKK